MHKTIYDSNYLNLQISVLTTNNKIDFNKKHSFISQKRHGDITPEILSSRWLIKPKQAILIFKNMSKNLIRLALMPLSCRYRCDLFLQKRRLSGKWYTATFYGRNKAVDSNAVSQLFANKKMFAVSYLLISKKYAREALKLYISQYGAPEFLTFDGAAEQCKRGTLFMKQVSLHSIKHHISECFLSESECSRRSDTINSKEMASYHVN